MKRKFHARFLGGRERATARAYPVLNAQRSTTSSPEEKGFVSFTPIRPPTGSDRTFPHLQLSTATYTYLHQKPARAVTVSWSVSTSFCIFPRLSTYFFPALPKFAVPDFILIIFCDH